MNGQVHALASLIRSRREQSGRKPVLMLGAGASFSSGVKPTKEIMEGLLKTYGQDLTEANLRERFDRLWERSTENDRDMFLRPYLELKPSNGYRDLARLIKQEYFDIVITFNFDQLLETALTEAGISDRDKLVIVRGEHHGNAAVRQSMEMIRPRVKILKMHGGLKGGDTFLFTRTEMHQYPEEIRTLLMELTRRDTLICGYAFEDDCVVRAFSPEGGSIYCVNPDGAPPRLKPILIQRRSLDWVIGKPAGYFDAFFGGLYQALNATAVPVVKPKANPFKFLVSFDVRDKEWFYGRRKLLKKVMAQLSGPGPRVLHLLGPSKAGKTSFVRAGLLANLEPDRFRPVYLRCQGALEPWLPAALGKMLPPDQQSSELKEAVKLLASSTDKHVVVVLDQFERVLNQYPDTEAGEGRLLNCLNGLCECACPNLTFVCVGTDDKRYLLAISNQLQEGKGKYERIPPLKARTVGAIIRLLGRKAGIKFHPDVVRAVTKRYEETRETSCPFTLAHVQAVCNLLAGSASVDLSSYEQVLQNDREALDLALNVCDIVSFVEDIPDESGRTLFRKVMKVIPPDSKKVLATYLKDHFHDLFASPELPEVMGLNNGGGYA